MPSTIELGSIVQDRYLIRQILKKEKIKATYLVADQAQYGESCLLREFISSEASKIRELFQQELNILKSLKHPQIQQVKDFFWEDEHLFIVESYIEGQSYQDWLQSHLPLTEPEAIQLLQQILPALSYLHNQQLAHRNISPSTLLRRSQDNREHVKFARDRKGRDEDREWLADNVR